MSGSQQLSEPALGEAQRHVESCQACSRKLQRHKSVQSEILRMRVPKPSPPTSQCIGDAYWLEVAAGLLSEVKTRELMKHAAQCGHCGPLLKNAAEALVDEATPSEEALLASLQSARPEWRKNMAATLRDSVRERQAKSSWWGAVFAWPTPVYAFAGIVAVAIVAWIGVRALHPPSAEQLLAQAYSEHRTLEVRIPGARYAPVQAERGTGQSDFDKPHSLLKAKDLIGEALSKNPNDPKWLQARARAELLDGNYESAIKSLQRALETQSDSPSLLTDLGSAYFVRAESANRPIDYGNAIESFGKALAKSSDDPIALFNRALACERMYFYTQAVDDWQHYLRIDPQGEWADDARRRLNLLKEKLQQHQKSQNEPLLTPEQIAKAGADVSLQEKINQRIEEYLNVALVDWIPRAYPSAQVVAPNATQVRSALAVLAEIAMQRHQDRWLADLLAFSSSVSFLPAAGHLSAALRLNDSGDNVAARQHASAAERLFAAAGNEAGALRARVEYIFASQDAQDGKDCVQSSKGVWPRINVREYRWLKAQLLIEQGNCVWFRGDLGRAQQSFDQAAQQAEAGGFREVYLRSQDHLSLLNGTIGNLAAAWARNHAALGRFWTGQLPAMRGYNLYYGCFEFARSQQQPHLQLAAWRDGVALSESFSDNVIRAMAHSLMADAAIAAGEPQAADVELNRAGQLFSASPQIHSVRVAQMEAETRRAEVETAEGRPEESQAHLKQLGTEISQLSDDLLQIMFYTTLGQAESAAGDDQNAESALQKAVGIAEVELRSVKDEASRLKWNEQTSRTYRSLAQTHLRRGDSEGALEIWEAYRGAVQRAEESGASRKLKPREVAARLPSLSRTTVISYALFPDGLSIWVYDDRGVFEHWTAGKRRDVESRAERLRRLCSDPSSDVSDLRQSSRELYDLLIAPVEQRLSADRLLAIEADDGLNGLPFEALLDANNRYFGDRTTIVYSPGIYYWPDGRLTARITSAMPALVAAVPVSAAPDAVSLTPLADAVPEGQMVAQSFSSAHLIASGQATTDALVSGLENASVFHFAGHAVISVQYSGLLLSDALLDASLLKKASLARMQLAVFSACDTQDGSSGRVYDGDSLVRVFLGAGVPHVVASRWNVDSAATRQFMNLFYRALLHGNTVADSIHQAQIGLRSAAGMAHPYYWSAFTAFELI